MSEAVLHPFVVRLEHDRITVHFGDEKSSNVIREEQISYAASLISALESNPSDLRAQQQLGHWLYRMLPLKPSDPVAASPVFTIRDYGVWENMPWELLHDGDNFLLEEKGARFQVFIESKKPGSQARPLGRIDQLKIVMITIDDSPSEKRRELISRLGKSPSFIHLEAEQPETVREKLRGIEPDVVLMDTGRLVYREANFSPPAPGFGPVNESEFAKSTELGGLRSDWSQITADFLFAPGGPPLIVAPSSGNFAFDALAAGTDSVVLYSRYPVVDENYYAFALALIQKLDANRSLDGSLSEAVRELMDIPSEEVRIPLLFSRFPFFREIIEEDINESALRPPDLRTAHELSSYRSDVAATKDRLGVQRDVENLCQVIMAKQWKPPLSIGLFGDWGSGKTSFINLMRKTIKATAERAQKVENSAFVPHVIQIDFNAWYYMDANLWANLVVRILEGIRTEVFRSVDEDKEGEEFRQIFERLHVLEEEIEKSDKKHEHLKTVVDKIDTQIGEKQTEQKTIADKVERLNAALRDSDNSIVKDYDDVQTALKKAISNLDLSEKATLTQALAEADKLKRLGNRIGAAWQKMRKNERWWLVLPLAVVLFWLGADPEFSWLTQLPLVKEATATVTTLLTLFISWSQSLAPNMKIISAGLDAVYKANEIVKENKRTWKEDKQKKKDVLESERNAALNEITALEDQKAEKTLEQEQLAERIEQLKRGKGLEEFLMSRAGSADYQQQLGIIALVHKDMRKLQSKLRAGMKVDDKGQTSTKRYDRVVLYIDDLDRCTPARVVEVLQAIHLLLSIPLFVVVVAVDPRWLLQCLLTHYQDLLHEGFEIEQSEWAVTPQNYLEKIFQIPFTLPSMANLDFPKYVKALFNLEATSETEEFEETDLRYYELENAVVYREEKIRQLKKQMATLEKPVPFPSRTTTDSQEPISEKVVAPMETETNTKSAETLNKEQELLKRERAEFSEVSRQKEVHRSTGDPVELGFDRNPKALIVSENEQEFVKQLLPLLTTPRMTKRMLNVYRLIRVSLNPEEIDTFEDYEHQAVLVLLAVMYSYPAVAAKFFTGLRTTNSGTLKEYAREISAEIEKTTNILNSEWQRLLDGIQKIQTVSDVSIYRRWLNVVGRFSFKVGYELAREQP